MKISKIRDVIEFSMYCRRDLSGHTQGECMRRNVPEVMGRRIDELRALDIAPRFAQDCLRRDEEILYSEAVIERWKATQPSHAVPSAVIH